MWKLFVFSSLNIGVETTSMRTYTTDKLVAFIILTNQGVCRYLHLWDVWGQKYYF